MIYPYIMCDMCSLHYLEKDIQLFYVLINEYIISLKS